MEGAAGRKGEPLLVTRLALPFFLLAAIVSVSTVASRLLPPTTFPAVVWSTEFVKATLSLLLLFATTGAGLFLACVALKWSFLSAFLTDSLAAVVAGSFFPFLDKTLLVNWYLSPPFIPSPPFLPSSRPRGPPPRVLRVLRAALTQHGVLIGSARWHKAFGMRIGTGAKVLLTSACSPSQAHLCHVGSGSMLFNAVLAPRPSGSVWKYWRGECGLPWAEPPDIELGQGVGLYVMCRVESGVKMAGGAQGAAFSRVEAGTEVGPGGLVVGNPSMTMMSSAGAGETPSLPWSQTALSLSLMVLHVGWIVGLVVLVLQVALPLCLR